MHAAGVRTTISGRIPIRDEPDDGVPYVPCFFLAAQYFFIRALTAFLAAADIGLRVRRFLSRSNSCFGAAGLIADPNSRCGKALISSAISALSS